MSDKMINEHKECGGKNIDKVKKLENEVLGAEEAYDLSELFKILGDATRLRILFTLVKGEMCVCDIVELVDVTQSAVSHQLRLLKQMDLVKFRRDGKTIYYSLADSHIENILSQGFEHINE